VGRGGCRRPGRRAAPWKITRQSPHPPQTGPYPDPTGRPDGTTRGLPPIPFP